MKTRLSITLISALLFLSLPAAADVTDGTILALDRKAKIIVLNDKTVWSLDMMTTTLATDLKAGDRVRINYESDEDGVSAINSIQIISK